MPRTEVKEQNGPRYLVSLPVRAEWDEKKTGKHIVTEGTTENIGPTGALVHLQQLPSVGSRIIITVQMAEGPEVKARAEVLRLVRDLGHPLASLRVVNSREEWRGSVWEAAGTIIMKPAQRGGEDQE